LGGFGVYQIEGYNSSVPKTKTLPLVLAALITAALLCGCSRLDSEFDSKTWKAGGLSSRGAMVQDLTDRGLLIGKTRTEVVDLLGEPDMCGVSTKNGPTVSPAKCGDGKVDWFGYNVVTIPRCNLWKCYLNVNFNSDTYRVEDLAVSD
jgi:hypothetical protein